jgi:hypothetical protein
MNFKEWMTFKLKLSSSSINKYNQAVDKTLSRMAIEKGITDNNLLEIVTVEEFEKIKKKLMELNEFIELNQRGNNMYSVALKKYFSFLEDVYCKFQKDIEEFAEKENDEDRNTSVMTLLKARLGQGEFRQNLIYKWKGCSVTGVNDLSLLVASHIKPWRDSNNKERLDTENGLLLIPNIDKCFDKGYISFDDSGRMLLWQQKKDVFESFGMNNYMKIRAISDNLKNYMDYHRENVFYG